MTKISVAPRRSKANWNMISVDTANMTIEGTVSLERNSRAISFRTNTPTWEAKPGG